MSTPSGLLRAKYSHSPLWVLVPVVVTMSLLMAAASVELLSAPSTEPSSTAPESVVPAFIDAPHA
jgi:hypothetical protein